MAEPAPCEEAGAGRRRALELVWRALSRRAHTEAEVRALLERRDVPAEVADPAIEEVVAAGYLDDADFARRFTEDRRRLDRWGNERIARELDRRGVGQELVARALAEQTPDDELDAACALLAERFPASPTNDRARNRALGLLVRRGYEAEIAYEAIRRHERACSALTG